MEEGHFYLQRKGKENFRAHFKVVEPIIYDKYMQDMNADSGYDIALAVVELVENPSEKPLNIGPMPM